MFICFILYLIIIHAGALVKVISLYMMKYNIVFSFLIIIII